MSFEPLSDRKLEQLSDEQLIKYIRAAGDAGQPEAGRRGLAILVFGYEANVKRRIRLKAPPHFVEDLAADALIRAIQSAFDGSSEGEFRGWLNTIVDRTVVDHYRRLERRPKESPLPDGDEQIWGEEPSQESEIGLVELQLVIDAVLAGLSDLHRRVIELHVFSGLTAAEVCEKIEGMTPDNVAQIASRFRKKLRERLDEEART